MLQSVTRSERTARPDAEPRPPGSLRRSLVGLLAWSLLPALPGVSASAEEPEAGTCRECHHAGATTQPSAPPHAALARSVHADLDCTDCHDTVSLDDLDRAADRPHGPGPHTVDCGMCHDAAASAYRKHGRSAVGEDPDIPTCWGCHGHHDTLRTNDRNSRVHPRNLADTCMDCHTDMNLVRQHNILSEGRIRLFESSVHGRANRRDPYGAATCSNCHSAPGEDGTPSAHRILGPADPESTIYYFNIPKTCGQCHQGVEANYWEGIHGQFVQRGEVESPVCTTCHGEHGIISPRDPASPVSPAKVAEQTCAPCHESVVLNEKYGVPGGRLRSYIDSYHGLKAKAGDVKVANCASCHGEHLILPSTDPRSRIHPDNLRQTCGECHPGISAELATAGIHTTATGLRTGWPEFFRKLYLVLIFGTIGLMLLHNTADWVRHIKQMNRKPFVIRLTLNETAQHWALMISFIVLVISGFALRFSEAWWVQLLFGWGDGQGFLLRGTIHRAAAVVLVLVAIWHVVYLFGVRGRHMLREMLPARYDFAHLWHQVLYVLGRRERKPAFKRFTYMEKAEYWALLWGTGIMCITGLLLWFDNYFISRWGLPKGLLDVMLVIHYYEAWLATLAIAVWHLYSTIYGPSVYPMNPSWLNGRMPKDMYTHEHPEGPRLKPRVVRTRIEDETEDEGKPQGTTPATG